MPQVKKRIVIVGAALLILIQTSGAGSVAAQESGRGYRGADVVMGIEEAARMALEGSRELAAARLAVREASELVSEAWSEAMPRVDVSASYVRNINAAVNFMPAVIFDPEAGPDDYIPVRFGADNQWMSTISVEQPLFKPALLAVGASSRYEALQAEAVRGQEQAVVTRVRVGYYDLLLAEARHRLTGESLARVRRSLEETRARYRAGFTSEYDVLSLEVDLKTLENDLHGAELAVRTAGRNLALEFGQNGDAVVRARGSLSEMNIVDLDANSPDNRDMLAFTGLASPLASNPDLVRDLEQRSDLRQLGITEELRRAELRIEKMSYLPEVYLFGSYAVNAQDNGSPNFFAAGDGQRASSQFAGVRVSLPIFAGLSRDARIDQKSALTRQAEALTRRASDAARVEVIALLDATWEARERADGRRQAVSTAMRANEIAQAEFREGLIDRMDLTDAELALRETEFSYAQAVYDYLVARARLDQATGIVPLVSATPDRNGR